jgi:hypothetical protein
MKKFLPFILAAVCLAAASDPPTLDINPRVGFEPATVRVKVTIPKDNAHAYYCLALVGEAYDTTSCRQLEGSKEARVQWREFKDIPAGHYVIVLDIQTSDGRNRQARTTFRVLGRGMTLEDDIESGQE